jgi:hypothetical protein
VKWLEGVAERFKAVTFHDSQKVKMLPGDEANELGPNPGSNRTAVAER